MSDVTVGMSDLRADYEREAWRAVLSTERGRAVVHSLLNLTNHRGVSFTGVDSQTNYQEGKRSVGVAIFDSVMATDRQSYVRMMNEFEGREHLFGLRAEQELEA